MQADRFARIDMLWLRLGSALPDRPEAGYLIQQLRIEYDAADREAQAYGLGEGFGRGHQVGFQEGYEDGLRDGRREAAHQVCLKVLDTTTAIMKAADADRTPPQASTDEQHVEQLAELEAQIGEGKAPIH